MFCARDRFGEKPFYYAIGKNGEFIFASEIKAIIATNLIDPCLSLSSLVHYFQNLYVHPSKTIYSNIFVLPPAHKLIFQNNKILISRYWERPAVIDISVNEAIVTFKNLLYQSIQKQLIADVDVGVFLSGGLDSSTITTLAAKIKPDIKIFSYDFETKSELRYSKELAKNIGREQIILSDNNPELCTILTEMQIVFDEPFADSSNIPMYLISREASKYVKVVLTGDGGDELLGGYTSWYKLLYYLDKLKDKSAIKKNILRIQASMMHRLNLYKYSQNNNLLHLHNALYLDRMQTSIGDSLSRFFIDMPTLKNLFINDQEIKNINTIEKSSNMNLNDILYSDLTNYMVGDILVKTDRTAMANGLELRSPFLDKDFASFCISLPLSLKINDKSDKFILREAYKTVLPKSIKNRSKEGFGAPVKEWLKRRDFQKLITDYLFNKDRKIYTIFDFKKTSRFISNMDQITWIFLVASLWLETHEYKRIEM